MPTFVSMLSGFIDQSVDVAVTGTVLSGTLTVVSAEVIEVQEPSGPYGPGALLNIPTINVDYVLVVR